MTPRRLAAVFAAALFAAAPLAGSASATTCEGPEPVCAAFYRVCAKLGC